MKADEAEPLSAPQKARRFMPDRDMPIMAFSRFRKATMPDSKCVIEQFRCIACDGSKEPKWTTYKQESALKHLGVMIDVTGELVARTDRNTGTSHSLRVREYEEKLKAAHNPGMLL
jgi:hypothetical protein